MTTMNPAGWPIVQIGDYLKVVAGPSFKSAEFVEGEDHIRLLRGDNIVQGKLRWDGVKRWHGDVQKRYHLEENDVVIAMDRPWIEAGLKWAWIQQKDLPAYLVQRVARLRATEGLDQKFLRYVIASPDFTAYIKPIVTGATVPHISGGQIESHRFPIPPLPTQRKIAAILSAYDDLIENNTRRVRVLEDMARALYREWFVEYRYPGHERDEFVEDEQGRRPKGWEWMKLGLLCRVMRSGSTPSRKTPAFWEGGSNPWFKTKELDDNFLFESEEKISDLAVRTTSAKILPAGTILMAIYAAPTVGRLGILSEAASCNQAALGMYVDPEKASQNWLFHKLFELRPHLNSLAQGAAQQNISKEKVALVEVLLPDRHLIDSFDRVTVPIYNQIKNLTQRNANLRRTRDLLLPRLVSGELDVSGLDIRGAAEDAEAVA